MKKLFLITVLIVSSISYSQVGLKGFILGEKLDLSTIKYGETGNNPEATIPYAKISIAGFNGTLLPYTLQDGRIYHLFFSSNSTFVESFSELKNIGTSIRRSIENNYKINFEAYPSNPDLYYAKTDGVDYAFQMKYSNLSSDSEEPNIYFNFNFDLKNIELEKIYKNPNLNISKDF